MRFGHGVVLSSALPPAALAAGQAELAAAEQKWLKLEIRREEIEGS